MRFTKNRKTHNWNIYPVIEAEEKAFHDLEDLSRLSLRFENYIPRGSGRSYGDNSLNRNILSTLRHNKILSFDQKRGVLKCQTGATIEDVLEVIIPHGWFVPVTPGTKFVSIGGAIAADVHGKNHHKEGSFSNHLESILLMLPNGEMITCSKSTNENLFWATCGGMGLTGVILEAEFLLKPIETSYVTHTSMKARDLGEMFRLIEKHHENTYSVAWIDSTATGKKLGRGLLYIGEHVRRNELFHKEAPLAVIRGKRMNIPFFFPDFILNPWSIYLFNQLLYYKQRTKTETSIVDYDSYFYPLDSIHNWNRMYGPRGFIQYQYVIPKENGERGVRKTLEAVNNSKFSVFLAGLKLFGKQDDLISFPMEGYTFGLDLPLRKGLFQFLEMLDEMVLTLGGRLYLAKDARMSRKTFLRGYPNATRFMELVKTVNPDYKIQSLQSKRLGITP